MKVRVAGAFLLTSIGAFASGCGTGVYGSAVTPAASPAAAASSAAPATAGAWAPTTVEKLKLIRVDGTPTLRVVSTKATQQNLGAVVVFAGRPTKGAEYRFDVRVRGSSNLAGRRLAIYLGTNNGFLGKRKLEKVTTSWQRFALPRRTSANDTYVRGFVYVPRWALPQLRNGVTKPDSSIEIQGAIRQEISAVSK
jgi:hypothetical protein